jgi:hypothetical protein
MMALEMEVRRVGKANGSRERAPDDRLRVPTFASTTLDGGHGAYAPLPTPHSLNKKAAPAGAAFET